MWMDDLLRLFLQSFHKMMLYVFSVCARLSSVLVTVTLNKVRNKLINSTAFL